jgi:hypothetical protein
VVRTSLPSWLVDLIDQEAPIRLDFGVSLADSLTLPSSLGHALTLAGGA